ncbi:MAG: helix-turn-helix transcriptional regulator [Clostridia bacterium]|nr:helix-turn-helix transcriptional regulator [Clostridia bacterium]
MKKAITQSTNWLTAGLSDEEILAKKTLAIIAADIQLKRIELGLDQKQFAKLLGVSQGMISRWESGTYNFTIATLVNICKKLGLSFKPQISSKEVEDVIEQRTVFTVFNVAECKTDNYSTWTFDSNAYCKNTNKAGAVA